MRKKWVTERNITAVAGLLFGLVLALVFLGTEKWPVFALGMLLQAGVLFFRGPLVAPDPAIVATRTHIMVRFLVVGLGAFMACIGANFLIR